MRVPLYGDSGLLLCRNRPQRLTPFGRAVLAVASLNEGVTLEAEVVIAEVTTQLARFTAPRKAVFASKIPLAPPHGEIK